MRLCIIFNPNAGSAEQVDALRFEKAVADGVVPDYTVKNHLGKEQGCFATYDELARTALYEAAHTLLVRSRKWSSLRAWGMKVAKARGMARPRRGRPQAGCDPASETRIRSGRR